LNAGFSTADPEQLFQPVITNPLYGHHTVNVEAQSRSHHSLLHWMQRLVQVRRSSRVFGRGDIRILRPANHRVLAYVRSLGDERVLVVNNLAASAQAAELDVRELEGAVPIEMFGGSLFPRIGSLPYLLTLGPHDFYWFRLRWL
jgi:maltose alpha-D-glucosyltransferase/alpha-amylase